MPAVNFAISEDLGNLRSDEVAYRVSIRNDGKDAVELLSLTPQIPDQVTLLRVQDPSLVTVKTEHDKICRQLEDLINPYLMTASEDLRRQWIETQVHMMKEITGRIGMFGFVMSMMSGRMQRQQAETFRKLAAMRTRIGSTADAIAASDKFFKITVPDPLFLALFDSKVQQLDAFEKKLGPSAAPILATIEPASVYAVTYVVRFPRSALNPRRFNLTVEGTFNEKGQAQKYVNAATTSVTISPKPWVLSVCAVTSALLGVALKLANDAIRGTATTQPPSQIAWQCLSATIAALLFFNIFENTEIGKNFGSIGVSWRSALLIGILCGFVNSRFIDALIAILGK